MKALLITLKSRIVHIVSTMRIKNKKVIINRNSSIDGRCIFEDHIVISKNTILRNCSIGQGSYLGKNNEFSSVKIGRFCSIGSFIKLASGRHPSTTFVSTHPAFFSVSNARGFTFVKKQKFQELHFADYPYTVTIGNDVWIGDNVIILDGVRIGDGAIIGTGALVTKDIEPYTINVGIPAKSIRKRFSEEEILFLLDFQWWNKDWEWIKMNSDIFDNIDNFKIRVKYL